jgi:hypothetical protein
MSLLLTVSARGNTNSDIEDALQRAYSELVKGEVSSSVQEDELEYTFELSGQED